MSLNHGIVEKSLFHKNFSKVQYQFRDLTAMVLIVNKCYDNKYFMTTLQQGVTSKWRHFAMSLYYREMTTVYRKTSKQFMKQGKINKKLNYLDSKATGNQNFMERIMHWRDFSRERDYPTGALGHFSLSDSSPYDASPSDISP